MRRSFVIAAEVQPTLNLSTETIFALAQKKKGNW